MQIGSALSPAGCSRRQFLSLAALAAAAPAAVGKAAAEAAPDTVRADEPAAPPAPPAGRGAAGPTCVHVFSKPLQFLSYDETAALVAEAGYGGIDFSVRRGGHVVPERVREDLPRAVEAARRAGLRVEMIATGILRADEPHAVATLETAAKLGVTHYRLGWFNYDRQLGPAATVERLKPVMRDLADLNRQLALHGAYQNHSGLHVGAAGWDLFELLRPLDPRWIGCQFDIRHATTDGGLCWPNTLHLLAPWIHCTDIKDFRWAQSPGHAKVQGMPIGEGIVDFATYFGFVRDLALSGPMSVHFEYPPFEGAPSGLGKAERVRRLAAAMRKDREALRQRMAAANIV